MEAFQQHRAKIGDKIRIHSVPTGELGVRKAVKNLLSVQLHRYSEDGTEESIGAAQIPVSDYDLMLPLDVFIERHLRPTFEHALRCASERLATLKTQSTDRGQGPIPMNSARSNRSVENPRRAKQKKEKPS